MKMNKLLSIGSLLFRVSFALALAFSLLAPMGSALAAQPQRPIEGDGAVINGAGPTGSGPSILVNEFLRNLNFSSTGDEWIELVLIQPMTAAELQSFYAGDSQSATTSKYSAYQFANMGSIASDFPAGTIIVVGGGLLTEDVSYNPAGGDWNIVLDANGSYLTSAGSGNGDFAGTDVAWVDNVATGATISASGFAVNWDSTPGAFGAVADVTISVPSNTTGAVLQSDLSGATTATNWAVSVPSTSLTMGQPNGGVNTTYIEGLRGGGAEPELSMTKTVSPATNVPLLGTVTYTVTLSNSGTGDAANLTLTDTLPSAVDFGAWVNRPAGAAEAADEITWNGTLTATTDLDFVFTAIHNGAYGDVVTNTAEYEYDTITGTAEAVFSVVDATSDVTFVYHDLEDVVLSSETVCIAGGFNSWSFNATPLTGDASGEVFTVTLNLATGSTYEYKYVLNCADWPTFSGDQLNTNNRSLTAAGDATQDDYRNVVVGWANLQEPSTLDAVAYQATDPVTGQVYINGVTNPAGEGRGIQAEVGFGDSATPAGWTWFPMTFDSQIGNNDLFTGIMTPTAVGVYSYTTRYDGNWGVGNPNAGWTYTDLNGTPFSVDDTGIMTVAAYDIGVTKTGPVTNVFPGDTFTYAITVTNFGSTTAANVTITDTLPLGANYVSDDSGFTPTDTNGVLVWTIGDLAAGASLSFELTVTLDSDAPNGTLTNLVEVATDSDDFNPANDSDTWDVTNPLISIQAVQYVANPATSDASPLAGQVVWVEGIVTAEPGEIDGTRTMFIEDPDGGPWSGLHIFRVGGFGIDILEGDYVRVQGQVTEYFGQTELSLGAGTPSTPWSVEVLSHNNPLPGPELLLGSQLNDTDKATSEQWESVYVEFGPSVVTNISLGNGEWYLNDGTGNVRVDDYGKPDGDLTYIIPVTQLGDEFIFVRGIPMYSYNNYKLEPRYDADIGLVIDTPGIFKTGPENVDPGQEMTYTLTVENMLGYDLTNVVITDVVPTENAAFARVLDSGTESGGIVTWVIPSLPYQASVDVQFVVTATGTVGGVITNDTYAVTANEYLTPTFGTMPMITVIGDYTPIYVIQGDDYRSEFVDRPVTTIGVVTGFLRGNYSSGGTFNAFFIQDVVGDSNEATSDGIMVISNISVAVNDVVTVTGVVEEHEEYDGKYNCVGDTCMTVIDDTSVTINGSGGITAIEIDPPGGAEASMEYYESIEGMLVTLPVDANVVGPTSYGLIQVVSSNEGIDRVMRASPEEGLNFGVRNEESNYNIAPNLIVGSIVSDIDGPFAFTYGTYAVIDQDDLGGTDNGYTVVYDEPLPSVVPAWPAVGDNEFSVAAFNTLNFDTASGAKFNKVVATLLQLNGPAFISLEEIDAAASLPSLITTLAGYGYNYAYAYSHPDTGGHGVAMLWNTDKVTGVTWSTDYQSCSPYGSTSSDYDLLWSYCRDLGEYPLFSRRPVVVTGTVEMASGDVQVVAIASHFKSKLGGYPSDMRRLGQGEYLNGVVETLIDSGSPYVIVMGDLNDFEDSAPLNALTGPDGALVNAWSTYEQEPYSYIYNGVSQILDHILVSPALLNAMLDMGPLHLNADYPYSYSTDGTNPWRTSDHEPVAATFGQPLDLTDLDLWQATDPVAGPWTQVTGTYTDGFTMTLDTTVAYYYLDTENITVNRPLADGYHPFYLITDTVPVGFYDYWAAKGVVAGLPPTDWQSHMWDIINGDMPMFYLRVIGGTDYMLVDGLTTLMGGPDEPLKVNGSYWPGIYTFAGQVSDADGMMDDVIVDITFNDIPVAEDQTVNTDEELAASITLTATDLYPGSLVWTLGDPANGTLSGPAPVVTYTPDADWFGTDTFTFTVNDGTSDSNTATVTIVVAPVNDAPVAEDLEVSTEEDTAAAVTLVASDVDGDDLTYTYGTPANGTLSGTAPALTYMPEADWSGTDTFTFTVNDGTSDSNTATVTIVVAPVNDAPVAEDLEVSTEEDTAAAVTLVASDVDGDDLTYTYGTPANGTLSGTAPALTYTPDGDWSGTDTFTFTVNDGTENSNSATVTITVNALNDAPVAEDLEVSTDEDTPVAVTLVASDVDSTVLTYTYGTPANGTLSGTAPDLTYTPDGDWSGTDTFTFAAYDGELGSNSATVTITVNALNDAPVAEDQAVSTDEETALVGALTATDADGDPMTYAVDVLPLNGSLVVDATGVFTYTPAANYNGIDSFSFTVNDGELDSEIAIVTITVTPVNDAPVAQDQNLSTDEDVAVDFALVASDVDSTVLTYTYGTPANGTLSGIAPALTYTPDTDWFGTDSFTFTVNDGELDSNVATVTIVVADVVDDPVLSITKDVDTGSGPVNIGDVVTYTISVANTSLVEAVDVHIVDTLPAGLIGEDVDITVTVAAEDVFVHVFTATVDSTVHSGATITNTATFEHSSGSRSDDASFQMAVWRTYFLPITFKNFGG